MESRSVRDNVITKESRFSINYGKNTVLFWFQENWRNLVCVNSRHLNAFEIYLAGLRLSSLDSRFQLLNPILPLHLLGWIPLVPLSKQLP